MESWYLGIKVNWYTNRSYLDILKAPVKKAGVFFIYLIKKNYEENYTITDSYFFFFL